MSKQITNEKRERIFASYLGAQIQMDDDEGIIKGTIDGVHGDEVSIVPDDGNESNIWGSITYCQLLLKPLSAISDEDAIEWYNLINPNNKSLSVLAISRVHKFINSVLNGKKQLSQKDVDFLRPKWYNCGYGQHSPQDLVDARVVIYETENVKP